MRATNAVARHKRKKRILKRVKGFQGRRKNLLRTAIEAGHRADAHAFIGRKQRKRNFRRLWITRLSAAARMHGLRYSDLMHGLKLASVELDRKQLSELAIHEPDVFAAVVEQAKAALAAKPTEAVAA